MRQRRSPRVNKGALGVGVGGMIRILIEKSERETKAVGRIVVLL